MIRVEECLKYIEVIIHIYPLDCTDVLSDLSPLRPISEMTIAKEKIFGYVMFE